MENLKIGMIKAFLTGKHGLDGAQVDHWIRQFGADSLLDKMVVLEEKGLFQAKPTLSQNLDTWESIKGLFECGA